MSHFTPPPHLQTTPFPLTPTFLTTTLKFTGLDFWIIPPPSQMVSCKPHCPLWKKWVWLFIFWCLAEIPVWLSWTHCLVGCQTEPEQTWVVELFSQLSSDMIIKFRLVAFIPWLIAWITCYNYRWLSTHANGCYITQCQWNANPKKQSHGSLN